MKELNLPRGSIIVDKEESVWDQHRWPLIGGFVFLGVQTGLIGFMLVARQREQSAKKKLLASQDNFRRAQEVGLVGSFVIDVNGKRVSRAEGTHELLGLPPTGQLNFEQFLDLVHSEDRGKVKNVWHNLANHQSGVGEFRLLSDAGTRFVRAHWQTMANAMANATDPDRHQCQRHALMMDLGPIDESGRYTVQQKVVDIIFNVSRHFQG